MDQKISILLPAKNAELFLQQCLDSILNQSELNWELLIVDDHSEDTTFLLMKEYQLKDERIHPLKNKGIGIIDALKTAYSNAQGNFITRMDADDIMHKEKLLTMKKQLILHGEGHVATSLVKYFADNGIKEGYRKYELWLNELTIKGNNFRDIYKECVIPSPSWMLFKNDVDKIGGFQNLIYPEDYALTFEMYKARFKVMSSNQVLHYWRDHSRRASRNDSNYKENSFLPLKVKYFLLLDYKPEKALFLWGAGTKGKKLAKLLNENNILFTWICDNPKKWGKEVYGNNIYSLDCLKSDSKKQIIIAFADYKDTNHPEKDENFFFC